MPLRRDHPVVRTLGVLFGIGILALGAANVLGVSEPLETLGATRTFGLGLVLLLAGLATIIASFTIADPATIF